MRLPFDLLSQNYIKPNLYLCETDKTRICELDTIEMSGSFKFNAYSELNFTIGRTYINMNTGETQVNPFYDKIEALRLVYLEGFGYFEIQDPEIVSDGIREVKNVTAYGLEYTLAQKYLENFNVNTGEADSIEVIYANNGTIVPVTLYNQSKPGLSLLDLALEKIYGWSIGHVDISLRTMSRQFEISRASVYDFIVQDICEKFNCFAVFDTIDNTINLYAEALVSKYIGDGISNAFIVSPPYASIDTVTIDGYKTTRYIYNPETGDLIFEESPKNGARIEVTDGSQEQWKTDVYVTFDNLAQEVNISYSADDIKTVLTVKGADDLDIREVNMGLPYIIDLSYYHSVDWMGKDLYDAYTEYLKTNNSSRSTYAENAKKMVELSNYISYEKNRLTLNYVHDTSVNRTTVGTYYIKGGSEIDPYYKEVSLPSEYKVDVAYYKISSASLNEEKFSKFYQALQTYFVSGEGKDVSELEKLVEDFKFVNGASMETLINSLTSAATLYEKYYAVSNFLGYMWDELGLTPLEELYLKSYQAIKKTNEEAGWNVTTNENYWKYYTVEIIVDSINIEIDYRKYDIEEYQWQYGDLQSKNNEIAAKASIYNVFTSDQLKRLSSFLREDEYTDDNFIITNLDTTETIMQIKQELRECGRIELSKLCEPKLSFSMDMANIYAIDEFAPIINQFQLGNLINVVIRSDYIKRARLLEVNINFDDFSDFSCEFGELTNLKTQSSIHADLLASALSAGKSVASNESYWNKNIKKVTELEIQLENGLANAVLAVKNNDGTQHVDTSKYGIRLQKYDAAGNLEPEEGWIVNNQFLYSSDNFKTTKSVFGKYVIDNKVRWGLIADSVFAGSVDSSVITGGSIHIGEYYDVNGDKCYAFEVDEEGNVTMGGANSVYGYATTSQLKVTDDSISAEVTRAKNAEATLRSSITINADNISSKVSKGDFGTLIEQNYDHVKIAWNKNSNYIKFENAELNIYNSSNALLMKMNYNGANYYYNGTKVGTIGTNRWNTDSSYRGLVFDLEHDAGYMCWAAKDSSTATSYMVKLIYHHNDTKDKAGLHFGCKTYADGNLYLTDDYRFVNYSNGIGYHGPMQWVDSSNSTCFKIDPVSKIMNVYGGNAFKVSNNVQMDFYSHLYMHNFDIYDTTLMTSSDVRLKTNIKDTSVNAVELINKIEMKEFDWINGGEHENIGMIAQQLQLVAPELVGEEESTGQLFIKTDKFIPYLIKAVQELSNYITDGTNLLSERDVNWIDPYTHDEKMAFAAKTLEKSVLIEPDVLEEIPQKQTLITIDNVVIEE